MVVVQVHPQVVINPMHHNKGVALQQILCLLLEVDLILILFHNLLLRCNKKIQKL